MTRFARGLKCGIVADKSEGAVESAAFGAVAAIAVAKPKNQNRRQIVAENARRLETDKLLRILPIP